MAEKNSKRTKIIIVSLIASVLIIAITAYLFIPRVSDYKVKSVSLMDGAALELTSPTLMDWKVKEANLEAQFEGEVVARGKLKDFTINGSFSKTNVSIPLQYEFSAGAIKHCASNPKIPLSLKLVVDLDATSWTGSKPEFQFEMETDCPKEISDVREMTEKIIKGATDILNNLTKK